MAMTRDDLRSRAEELLGRVQRAGRMGDHDRARGYERELRGVWASLARMGSATGPSMAERPAASSDGAMGTVDAPAPIGPDPIRNEVDRLHDMADRAILADDLDAAQSYARQAAALQGRAVDAPATSDLTDAQLSAMGHADEVEWLGLLADIRRADAAEPDPATETELLDLYVAIDSPDAWATEA